MALKLNLASGAHPLPGFVNLDKETGWLFQDGLSDYEDGSVDAISESHGLMHLPIEHWLPLFTDIARVLAPGGVLRITEDSTDDLKSERFGGFDGAVTLTSAKLVIAYMDIAGFEYVAKFAPDFSRFHDDSLIQRWHGEPPKVFHVEGLKP